MASALSGLREGIWKLAEQKRQRPEQELDQAVKYAQLAESGYNVRQEPKRGMFGRSQMVLEQNPNFQSLKELQRQKLQNDLEMGNYKLQNARRYFGGVDQGSGQTFGGGSTQEDFVMSPDGRFVANPNKVKPLNELQKAQLADRERKASEAQAANDVKEESLINTANENLRAIEESKKGLKYFGPLGKMPSVPVITGDYSKRKNWENNINKVLSGKVLEVMNEMKRASKTGATGFGALNEKELAILQGASTALSRDLAPKDALRYLNEIETMQRRVLSRGGKKFGQQPQIPDWASAEPDFYQLAKSKGHSDEEISDLFKRRGIV